MSRHYSVPAWAVVCGDATRDEVGGPFARTAHGVSPRRAFAIGIPADSRISPRRDQWEQRVFSLRHVSCGAY